MSGRQQQHLLHVLNERNLPIGEEARKALHDGPNKTRLASWVTDYLQPSTLLTQEELSFHENRFQNGALSQSGKTSKSRALDDAELETAIASLEASTAAIDQQCRVLEAQKRALQQLKARNATSTVAKSRHQDRQKLQDQQKAQLDFEVMELAASVQEQLSTSTKHADVALSNLPANVERVLTKDDRLLDGLQKVLSKLEDADEGQADVVTEVEKLCQALTALTAQEIRVRVDAAYNAKIGSSDAHTNGYDVVKNQQHGVLAELSELSGEIDSLATMAVDGKYRRPILRELKRSRSDAEVERGRWGEYIIAAIQYLTNRLEALDDHTDHLHIYQATMQQIESAFQETVAEPKALASNVQVAVNSPSTPQAKGLKPLRLVQANISEPQDLVTQILRYHGIRFKDPSDTTKLVEVLVQASKERTARVDQLGRSTERSIIDLVAGSIAKADHNVQDLLAVVFAHSKFGRVRVMDGEIESGLEELEAVTDELRAEAKGLAVEELVEEIRRKQRECLCRGGERAT
ncbi:hypothetical protein LTR62_004794 [Meristemomyces frigidus]|uniref:Uncharacterized protein n=1 Tax=Meristemomyces frigidus TaxID=1508187 RepID=A0AAN7YNX6_9PEZI|nr:hypothetical protein LTR62_004794 [Meristemomyces frigidus]